MVIKRREIGTKLNGGPRRVDIQNWGTHRTYSYEIGNSRPDFGLSCMFADPHAINAAAAAAIAVQKCDAGAAGLRRTPNFEVDTSVCLRLLTAREIPP